MSDVQAYVQVRSHNIMNPLSHWVHVRHFDNNTYHVYHIRCHKLSDYVVDQKYQVCTTCDVHMMEEPVPPPPP